MEPITIDSVTVLPLKRMSGAEVRKLRNSMHLSQSVFAAVVGVGIKAVQAWERNVNRPAGSSVRMMQVMSAMPDVVLDIYIKRGVS